MKFPENWLREWVNPELDSAALVQQLTMSGHEVDEVVVEGAGLGSVRIAEVVSVVRHPNADKLSVCQVRSGKGASVEVVCGAPNVRKGMKTAFAAPGVVLPNGMKLERSTIRGVVSNGMLCSALELGLGDESDGIIELPDDAPTGIDLAGFLALPDTILDVNLTPNRGDCCSVAGLARDLSAVTGTALRPHKESRITATVNDRHDVVIITPAACPRFAGRVIRGIDARAVSPLWLQERLRRAGLRSIHPVVDVTNYVMVELGQPLHAYDQDRLTGAVRPRFAKSGERLVLLDDREVELDENTLVISDDSGPIGLAGIMGGRTTAVSNQTMNVFLEGAFWPPNVIAGRARRYALHTDASLRFERGVDPMLQGRAVERATELLLEICGGAAGPLTDLIDRQHLPKPVDIRLRRSQISRLLGIDIEAAVVERILESLQINLVAEKDGWRARVPSYRFDLRIEHDLIEEVARIFGYDRIPEETGSARLPIKESTDARVDLELVADTLVARDYREVVTYSFVDTHVDRLLAGHSSDLVLSNPISSEMSVMRGSLCGGMLAAAAMNLSRQQDRVRLFEIGKTFHGTLKSPVEVVRVAGLAVGTALAEQWGDRARAVDFFDIKSDVEALLALTGNAAEFAFSEEENVMLQPGQSAEVRRNRVRVGCVGKLHPVVTKQLGLRRDVFLFELDADAVFSATFGVARPVSRFPSIRRDIAVIVKDEVCAAQLQDAVAEAVPDLIREVKIFDVYKGPGIEAGLKSIALGLILQETSRTLTDQDADIALQKAVRKLQLEYGAELRD
ncbi:MAG TPA: phenylalanine--tRNA ligase subunit beta [Woeseiaceae bacterium]|nr:phenylalanine--tRNA ligase subunit beta [Woeseiaceae bacterium]